MTDKKRQQKKRPAKSNEYDYHFREGGVRSMTTLGERKTIGPMEDGYLGCLLQAGDKSLLRRAGVAPEKTIPAVYIAWGELTILYDKNRQRLGRPIHGGVEIAVNEWLSAHGVTR